MMKAALFAILFTVSNAQAATFFFGYNGPNDGRMVYLTCDYVQEWSESVLERMGVNIRETYCYGGFDPHTGMMSRLSMQVSYRPMKTTDDMIEEKVQIKFDSWEPECDFQSRFVRTAVRTFKNVKILKTRSSCFGGGASEFELLVKRPR